MIKENAPMVVNVSNNNIAILTNSANMSADDFNTDISFHLGLLYNNIKRINITFYKQEFRIKNRSHLLNLGSCGIDIRFNHLICDFCMYEKAAWLKQFQHTDHRNPVFTIKCYSPPALYGTDLVDVNDTDFNCTVVEQCPSGCKCVETYSSKLLTVTCNGANFSSTLPDEAPSQFKEIHINIKNTPLEVLEPRPYLNKVTILDISQNKIKFIDEHTLPYLNKIKTVCLNGNLLNYLPKKLKSMSFTNLTTLKLDGNPFKCDCHSLWMKKWLLTHTGQIPNQDTILCRSGIPMTETNDANFLCSEPLSFDIVLSIVFGASLLIMIIGLMVRRNWTHIQVLLKPTSTYTVSERRLGQTWNMISFCHTAVMTMTLSTKKSFLDWKATTLLSGSVETIVISLLDGPSPITLYQT